MFQVLIGLVGRFVGGWACAVAPRCWYKRSQLASLPASQPPSQVQGRESDSKTRRRIGLVSLAKPALAGLRRSLFELRVAEMEFLERVRFILQHCRWEPLIADERDNRVAFRTVPRALRP